MAREVRATAVGLARRVVGATAADDEAGWATLTLERSVRRALLLATAVWQAVMVVVCLVTPGPVSDIAWLLAAHLGALVLALLARNERAPGWAPILAVYALFLADWNASQSVEGALLFASCWMMNLASAAPAFVVRGRASLVLPVAAAIGLPPLMILTRPDVTSGLPAAVLVTGLSIVAATRLGMSHLVDVMRRADLEQERSARASELAASRRAASLAAAESARVVHDTVVNTLAAVASGGSAVADAYAVKERARHDLATLAALREGRTYARADVEGLRHVPPGFRLPVRHDGLGVDEIASVEARLDPLVRQGLLRAVQEVLRNADKHSGGTEVRVSVGADDDQLTVAVTDDGVGFDGRVPADRGLERSVIGRAEESGIDVELTTAPGAGTKMTLTCPLEPRSSVTVEEHDDFLTQMLALRRRASHLYAAGVAAVGLVLAVANHPGELTGEYAMVTVAGAGAWLGWRSSPHGRPLPPAVSVMLGLGACVAFVCAAAAVDFGRTDAALWQAIGPTGLLVLLAEAARSPRTLARACALYATVVVTVGLLASNGDPGVLAVVLTAGAAGLGIVAAWRHFQNLLDSIGRQASLDQRHAADLRIEARRREAADRAHDRWRTSSLDQATTLLRQLADGTTAPTDPHLREQCSQAEAHLRQLTTITPDLLNMGQWLARALDEAHRAGATLVVRTGDTDVDEATAHEWGRLIIDATTAMPPGSPLTITLFPVPTGVRLTLVAEHPHLLDAAHRARAATPSIQTFGTLDVVEVESSTPGSSSESLAPSTAGAVSSQVGAVQ